MDHHLATAADHRARMARHVTRVASAEASCPQGAIRPSSLSGASAEASYTAVMACHTLPVMKAKGLSLAFLLGVASCGGQGNLGTEAEGYSYTTEQIPHPGIAEGRPVVTLPDYGTFYACPPMRHGEKTPLLADSCLVPGDAATSKYGKYSQLQASTRCPDGRFVTDAGDFGVGFVGEPFLPRERAGPIVVAVEDCLRQAGE